MSALSGLALKDKKYWGIIVPVGIGLFGLYYRKTHKLNTLEDEIILGASPSEVRCLWCCKKFVQEGARKNSLYHSEAHRKLGLQKLKWNIAGRSKRSGITGDTIGKLMRQLQQSGKNGYGARGWIDATYSNYKIGSKRLHPAGLARLLKIYVRDDVYTINKDGKVQIFKWKKGHCLKNWLKPKYVKYLTTNFSAEEYIKKQPHCPDCGTQLQWDNVRKARYCTACPFNTYPKKKAESFSPKNCENCNRPLNWKSGHHRLDTSGSEGGTGTGKGAGAGVLCDSCFTFANDSEFLKQKPAYSAESFEASGKKAYTKKELKWMWNRPPDELIDVALNSGVVCSGCGANNMWQSPPRAFHYSQTMGGTLVYYPCGCGNTQEVIYSAEEEEETEDEHPHGPLYCDVCERHYGRKVMIKPKTGEEPRPDVFTDCLCGRKERARKMEDESSFGRKLKKLREEGKLSTGYYDEERPTTYEKYPREEPTGVIGTERRKEHWPPTAGMHWYDEIGEQMTFWIVPSWHTACIQCGNKTTKGGLLQVDEGSMGMWEEPSVFICNECVNESELLWWAITGAKPNEPRNPLLKGLLAESFEAITVDPKPKMSGRLICGNCNDGYNVVTCDDCGESWCDDCDTKEGHHNCNTKDADTIEIRTMTEAPPLPPEVEKKLDKLAQRIDFLLEQRKFDEAEKVQDELYELAKKAYEDAGGAPELIMEETLDVDFGAEDDEDTVLEEQIDTIREGIEQVGQFARDADQEGESAFYTGYQMALETIVHALESVGRDRTLEEMYIHIIPGLRVTLQEARKSGSIDNVWEVKGAIEATVEMVEFLSEFPPEWAIELAAEDIDTYRGKRKAPTPEPGAPGTSKKGTGAPMKVQGVDVYSVQEHHAEKRGPHRDIRIGYDDATHGPVLLSFVPTGGLDNKIPTKVGRNHKITVIQTEDHPFDYWHFEGSIPSGSYGAGPVSLETYGKSNIISYEPGKKLKVEFTGGKYPGTYVFIHYRGKVWGMWRYE